LEYRSPNLSPTLLLLSLPPHRQPPAGPFPFTATQQARICHPERSEGSASAFDLKFLNFQICNFFSSPCFLPFRETKRSLLASKKLAPQTVKLVQMKGVF